MTRPGHKKNKNFKKIKKEWKRKGNSVPALLIKPNSSCQGEMEKVSTGVCREIFQMFGSKRGSSPSPRCSQRAGKSNVQRNFNEGSGGTHGDGSAFGAGMGKGTELRGTWNGVGAWKMGVWNSVCAARAQESSAAEPKPWGGHPELRGGGKITTGEREQKCAKPQGEMWNLGVRM